MENVLHTARCAVMFIPFAMSWRRWTANTESMVHRVNWRSSSMWPASWVCIDCWTAKIPYHQKCIKYHHTSIDTQTSPVNRPASQLFLTLHISAIVYLLMCMFFYRFPCQSSPWNIIRWQFYSWELASGSHAWSYYTHSCLSDVRPVEWD